MNAKKTLALLGAVAVLSLSSCYTIGREIDKNEADAIQAAILKENEERKPTSYTIKFSVEGKRVEGERNEELIEESTVSFDMNKCVARLVETKTTTLKTTEEATSTYLSYDYCLFYKEGYLYFTYDRGMRVNEEEYPPSKEYAKKTFEETKAKSLFAEAFKAPDSLDYGMRFLNSVAPIASYYQSGECDVTYYSRDEGNLTSQTKVHSDDYKEKGTSGQLDFFSNITIDDFVVTSIEWGLECTKTTSGVTTTYDYSGAANAIRRANTAIPDIKDFKECEADPALAVLNFKSVLEL